MKTLCYSYLATGLVLLLLNSCVSINPVNDTVDPDLSILLRLPNANPAIILANTDTSRPLTKLGCPQGTFWVGQNTNSYFLDLPQTVGLTVFSQDKGAVRDMVVTLSGSVALSDVTNVSAVNDPDADIEIVALNPAEVQINVIFKNLRTGQILTFDVATNDEALIIEAETSDFNNNRSSLPQGPGGGSDHGGQIIDIAVCDN